MVKNTFLLCFLLFFSFPSLAQDKVTVVAEKANIYAEPHERAHLIESVKKGAVLTLFQKGIIRDVWYYVSFYSQRYRGRTTGFIRVEQVGPWSETATKPPPPPEPEANKEQEVTVEESQTTTSLLLPKVLLLPQEETELRERTWLSTDLEFTYTTLPKPLALSLPPQHPTPQDLSWRASETESTLTQAPAGQILKRLEAQDTLKTEEYAPPSPPPPQPKPPASSLKPAEVRYSDSVHLIRSSESLEFNLTIGPYSRFRHFEMTEPNRIVMDFFEVSVNADFQKHPLNEMGIESIRIAMFEETTARVVFDFREEIPAYQIEQTENGLKLQFWTEAADPEKDPEPKIEELPADTGLPPPRAWTLPREPSVLSEKIWTVAPPTQKENIIEPVAAQPPVEESLKKVEKEKVEVKPEKVEPEQVIPKPPISPQVSPPRKTGPFTLSLGIGTSTGGAGGFVQYNTKGGLALHAGLGMYPTSYIYSDTDWVKNEMLYSVGVKYYLPFKSQYLRPYLDVQYGGFAIEAVQIIVGIWEYQYIYQNEQKALYGPTALVGGEVKLGTLGLNLAAGVSYAASAWEWKSQDFYFSFDLSLIYTFK